MGYYRFKGYNNFYRKGYSVNILLVLNGIFQWCQKMKKTLKLFGIGLGVSLLELLFSGYFIFPWFRAYGSEVGHLISKVSGNSVVIAVCTYLLCERLDKIIKLLQNERKSETLDKRDDYGLME